MMGSVLWQVGLHTDMLLHKFMPQNSSFMIYDFILYFQTCDKLEEIIYFCAVADFFRFVDIDLLAYYLFLPYFYQEQ